MVCQSLRRSEEAILRTSLRRIKASCLSRSACPTSGTNRLGQGFQDASKHGYEPALSTNRLSIFDFHASHVLLVSQSSFPQQQVARSGGSGDVPREKLDKANVRSSMLCVMRCRLLDIGESGVGGRWREVMVSGWLGTLTCA